MNYTVTVRAFPRFVDLLFIYSIVLFNMAFNYEWENVAVVGRGGSSTVYKAIVKPEGRFVAVKQIEIDGLSKDQISGIKGEIETMKDLSHTNILSYLGTQQSPNRAFIFLEYADRGSLRQYYQNKGPLTEPQISYCLHGILAGLGYLHNNGIAHRDIKCANCLLCSDGVVKLADFGASKRFESVSLVSGLKGTPHWMAPEVIKGTQMTTGWMKADVWSLGCTVVEMFTAKVPYAEYENPMTAMYKIASGEIPSLKPSSIQPNKASEGLISFIHICCAVDPTQRPAVEELQLQTFVATATVDLIGSLFAAELEPLVLPTSETATSDATGDDSDSNFPSYNQSNNHTTGNTASRSQEDERESATAITTHRIRPEGVVSSRLRAESRGSVMSADDDTTIANNLDTSYVEEEYGYSHESMDTPSRSVLPISHMSEIDSHYSEGVLSDTESGGAVLGGVGIAASDPPSSREKPSTGSAATAGMIPGLSRSTSGSAVPAPRMLTNRGRSFSRDISINTVAAAPGDAPVVDFEDAPTPSMHNNNSHNTKSASVKVNVMPLLGKVSGMSLENTPTSSSMQTMARQWSTAALPTANMLEQSATQQDISEASTPLTIITPASVNISTADRNHALTNRILSFEDANEVYRNMMNKYSPRPGGGTKPEGFNPEASSTDSETLLDPIDTVDEVVKEEVQAADTVVEVVKEEVHVALSDSTERSITKPAVNTTSSQHSTPSGTGTGSVGGVKTKQNMQDKATLLQPVKDKKVRPNVKSISVNGASALVSISICVWLY